MVNSSESAIESHRTDEIFHTLTVMLITELFESSIKIKICRPARSRKEGDRFVGSFVSSVVKLIGIEPASLLVAGDMNCTLNKMQQ